MAPQVHCSGFRVVAPFAPPAPLEEETPLFAADLAFARAQGGPITRAFLAALPADWTEVVVDSSLVWLVPGLAHGIHPAGGSGRELAQRAPPRFFHEIFPGVDSGVRGAANRNPRALHRACYLGLPRAAVAAEGELSFPGEAAADLFWHTDDFEARDREIERWLAAGALRLRELPASTIVEYGWGSLQRLEPARRAGFSLFLRATAFDPRPAVNGRRNAQII